MCVGLTYCRYSRLGTDRFRILKATRRRRPFCFFRTLRFPVFREPTTGRFRRSFLSRQFQLSVTRVGFPWDEARNKPFDIVSCGGRDRSTETVFQSLSRTVGYSSARTTEPGQRAPYVSRFQRNVLL